MTRQNPPATELRVPGMSKPAREADTTHPERGAVRVDTNRDADALHEHDPDAEPNDVGSDS